jgi:hypothetical protein
MRFRAAAVSSMLALVALSTGAQDSRSLEDRLVQGIQSIHPARMREALTYLASDELEGRLAGFPGNDKATEFIAARYAAAGLTPVGDRGADGRATYYQHFDTPHGTRTRNTVGVLEGTDPELKKEFLVVGAHHDHVGRLGQRGPGKIGRPVEGDEIWNGADDNGSGTTTVLSIVRAFAASGLRLRRSVLFMTYSAEEWGLLGSKHYVEHPIFPLDTVAAMLNLDMVGRGSLDRPTGVGGMATAKGDIFREAVTRAAEAADIRVALEDSYGLGSDMASFGARRVPVLSFSENGPCPDYHRVTDHADKIEYEYMARIGRMVFLTIVALGDSRERPRWNPEFKIPSGGGGGGGPRLGITTEEPSDDELAALKLGEGEGAVRLTGVTPGSVAEACGLREGDLLIGFGGSRLPREDPLGELRKRISEVKPGVPVPVEFARGGERRRVEATWPQ